MGSTNREIEELAKGLKLQNFRGCKMRDELKSNTPDEKESMIINLETSKDNGSHWSLLYKDGDNKIYYSTCGDSPPVEVINYLGKNIYTSDIQIQDFNEDTCGLLAILILYLLDEGNKFEDIILELSK